MKVCRGSYTLGNACGECDRCHEELTKINMNYFLAIKVIGCTYDKNLLNTAIWNPVDRDFQAFTCLKAWNKRYNIYFNPETAKYNIDVMNDQGQYVSSDNKKFSLAASLAVAKAAGWMEQ